MEFDIVVRDEAYQVIAIIKTYLATPRNRRGGDEEALQMAGSLDDSRSADEIVSRLRQERTRA